MNLILVSPGGAGSALFALHDRVWSVRQQFHQHLRWSERAGIRCDQIWLILLFFG